MKIHFQGANRQVTGSRYCLVVAGTPVMVDCGMFQEREYSARNWTPFLFPPNALGTLVLTHAHIDHCGLIPRLVAQGFRGTIMTTRATGALLGIMLRDAAKIQEEDVAYKLKRHRRAGRKDQPEPQPLFTMDDAEAALKLVQTQPFREWITVNPALQCKFHDAGHILGSAWLEFALTEQDKQRTVVFSGDIGQCDKPLIRDPELPTQADYVVMESTYGDREHPEDEDIGTKLAKVLNETITRGGKVIIPTFALERAQELMYYISSLVHDRTIPSVPVYLDSPMAVDVTDVFRKHRDHFDEETWQRIHLGAPPLQFPGLHMARSTEESRAINDLRGPAVIMSTSGMCTAGRIKHHLRQNIQDAKNTILFVGYQGNGTLGRQILDGSPRVRIHGRDYQVKAKIDRIYGFSAHGDRSDLLRWLGNLASPPRRVYLTHGEEAVALHLAKDIKTELKYNVSVPHYESMFDLD